MPTPSGIAKEATTAKDATLARRFQTGRIAYAARLTASTSITPTAGKKMRVVWVSYIPSSDNTVGNRVTIKFRSAANPLYTGEAMAHWESFEGIVDDPLDITLVNSQPVDVNIHYEEF